MVPMDNLRLLAGCSEGEIDEAGITITESLHALTCRKFHCPRCRRLNKQLAQIRMNIIGVSASPTPPPSHKGQRQ